MTSLFETRVLGIVRGGADLTLDDVGGLDGVPLDAAMSPTFAYVAAAIVDAHRSGAALPRAAVELIVKAVADTPSGLALGDTCVTVVPVASSVGITPLLKEALRNRTAARSTAAEAAMAGIALQALCHLAVLDDSARPGLLDVIAGVAVTNHEEVAFAVAAARVASIAFDHWRDPTAVRCLERLTESEAEGDAWFGLGHVRLAEALDRVNVSEITAALHESVEPFARAVHQGEDRPDARMYLAVVQFLSSWSVGAPADELTRHLDGATEGLKEFWFGGFGLGERYGWYRPRFDAEVRWIDLLRIMRVVAAAADRDQWYQPPLVITALAEALEAARTLQPAATALVERQTGLADFIEPRLAAPFLENIAQLAWLDRWLAENPGLAGERLNEAVRQRAEEHATPGKAQAEEFSALEELLGTEALKGESDRVLGRINRALLDKQALRAASRPRVISEALRDVVGGLIPCPDFVGLVREQFEWLIDTVIHFLHSRMNVEKRSAAGRFAYLFDPNTLEKELASDLKSWLEGNYPGTVLAEVHEIGGGRTDLIVQCQDFRLVIELKREQDDSSRKSLARYLPQAAAYQSTDVALGMLVVLDLTSQPTAPANVRDNTWVEVVEASHPGERDRFVVTVRVPGNRKSPSTL